MLVNLFNILTGATNGASTICDGLQPVMRIVGIVILGIKIVVPIILIIVGMIDLAKAVTEKNEDNIKKAQQALIKKAIAAVLVFLVVSIVTVLMTLIGSKDYDECMDCIKTPFSCSDGQTIE